jgi:hypothetical protein
MAKRLSELGLLVLITFVVSMVACSGDGHEPGSPSAPTASSGGLDRRVEDVGGGPRPTPIPCSGKDCVFSFSITTLGGETIAGTCQIGFDECDLDGSGRFTGAVLLGAINTPGGTTEVSSLHLNGDVLSLNLILRLPSLGNQLFKVTGRLDADVRVHPDSGCASGMIRDVTFSGVLPQLGSVNGTYSTCVPR